MKLVRSLFPSFFVSSLPSTDGSLASRESTDVLKSQDGGEDEFEDDTISGQSPEGSEARNIEAIRRIF